MPKLGFGQEEIWWQVHLGSDSKKPPRPKHLFSFSGQNKQPANTSTPKEEKITRDDILNSLTRAQHPQEGPLEGVPDTEEAAQFQDQDRTVVPAKIRSRGSARGALVIFLGGFLAVWLYGYVTGAYEIPYFSAVTKSPQVQVGVRLVSSNPILFGALSASVLLGTLYLRHRRRN
jgi:hypothetical protein